MTKRRVVITGLGAVTPIGVTANDITHSLRNALSGVGKISLFDSSTLPVQFAGEASSFKPEDFLDTKEIRRNDRFIQMCLAASEIAIKDSGLSANRIEQAGVVIGVGLGGLYSIEEAANNLLTSGHRKISPFFVPSILANLASGQVSIKYAIKGPNYSVSSACASGSQAIGQAYREIQAGRRDVWIAGGAEAPISSLSIAGFSAARALSRQNSNPTSASRPFDQGRDGFVLGEGAATFVLESYDSAVKRNAKIYAEIIGFGISSDGYHVTEPEPNGEGAYSAMRESLDDAQIAPNQIQYVNAHATSTQLGDQVEAIALERIFGSHSASTFVSSTKSLTGHSCGAAGAIEMAFCVLMLEQEFLAPAFNLTSPSAEFKFRSPTQSEAHFKSEKIMNNSFGFGGINTSLIIARPK